MCPGRFRHSVILVFAVALLAAFLAAQAGAAGLVVSRLPQATQGNGLSAGSDGAIWFDGRYGAAHEGDARSFVARLGGGGELTEFPLSLGREGGPPVADSEGDIWFLENHREEGDGGYGVGRVTTAGELQEYTLGGGYVKAMAASGRNLWLGVVLGNEQGGQRRSVVEGVVTAPEVAVAQQFSLRPPCAPSAIAARNNAIWFAESCESGHSAHRVWKARIVHLGPTGALAWYRLPPRSLVESLAIGSDGSVWFGSRAAGGDRSEFGRIAPSGKLTSYRVPDGDPGVIAIGPEGRLWFPSSFGGKAFGGLNSIGPKGHLGKPVCAAPRCRFEVDGLTTGPDGNLWFSATKAHAPYGGGGGGASLEHNLRANEAGVIGRLVPPGHPGRTGR